MKRSNLRLAVLGDPVEHSLSPAMHTAALKECGLAGTYEAIHVRPDDLPRVVRQLTGNEYTGFNVTVPHKRQIESLLDRVDPEAARIRAVNTVVNEGGSFVGFNSDLTGFRRMVERIFPGSNGGHSALVLGAGGAAHAVVGALLSLGWRVTVANRTIATAQNDFETSVEVIALSDAAAVNLVADQVNLLVNATSVGMNRPEKSPLPDSVRLPAYVTVVDLVYAPLETRLLRDGRDVGCPVVDGLELLAAQAADAFELWTNERLPDSFFREAAHYALMSEPVESIAVSAAQ